MHSRQLEMIDPAKRLAAYEPNRIEAFKVETDIIENLKRINTLTRRIARLAMTEDKTEASVAAGSPAEKNPIGMETAQEVERAD